MKESEVLNALEVVDGRPVVSSLNVAASFGKRHDDVLKKIRLIMEEGASDPDPAEASAFTARNFAVSEYTDATGRKLPIFNLTRDGFTFLAMGFTGSKANAWKRRYMNAFNAMEAELLAQKQGGSGAGSVPPGSTGQTDTIRLMELALQLEIAKAEGRVTESDVMDTFSQLHDVTQGRPAKPRFRDVTTPMGGRPQVKDEDKVLNSKEAEEFLGEYGLKASKTYLYTLVQRGEIVGSQLRGRQGRWNYTLVSLQDYVTKHTGKIFRRSQVVPEQPKPQPVQVNRKGKLYDDPDPSLFRGWLKERTKESQGQMTGATDLYKDFMAYAKRRGYQKHITQVWFGKTLVQRFPKINRRGVHWYIGIQLK